VICALRETGESGGAVAYHLWASGDHMRSWHQVDRGLPAAVAGFWIQPKGSGILVVVSGGAAAAPTQLWSSPNDGATWHQLEIPGGVPSYIPARVASLGVSSNSIVVRSLQGHFHICVSTVDAGASAQHSPPPSLVCSLDGGSSWQTQTMLVLSTAQGSPVGPDLVGITDDGTLL